MYPVLLDLGKLKIYSFGTLIVIAFLVSSWYVRRRAMRTLEVDGEKVFNLCFILLFVALAGARLLYVIVDYEAHVKTPMSAFAIWNGGLVFYGGLLAGLLWLAWYMPRKPELKGWQLMDILALGACLAIFVGRWASFLSGENYGTVAPDLAWGVKFPLGPDTQVPADMKGVSLHPTQLYHSLHGIVLFGLLLWYAKRKPASGRVAGVFLMLYAIGRSIIEIWRGDDAARGMIIEDVLSTSQLISVPIFFLGLAIFLMRRGDEDLYAEASA